MNLYPSIEKENLSDENRFFLVDNICGTIIKKSTIHGYGLFAEKVFHPGDILCLLDGQIVSWSSHDKAESDKLFKNFNNYLFMEWNALEENALMIRPFRTKYSFINHSRKPNLVLRRYPLAVISGSHIEEGEELTIDYRKEPLNKKYLEKSTYL